MPLQTVHKFNRAFEVWSPEAAALIAAAQTWQALDAKAQEICEIDEAPDASKPSTDLEADAVEIQKVCQTIWEEENWEAEAPARAAWIAAHPGEPLPYSFAP